AAIRFTSDFDRRRADLRPGTVLMRAWKGCSHRVKVVDEGFAWNGKTYDSLSKIACAITGTKWNGPRFFGLRDKVTAEVEEWPGFFWAWRKGQGGGRKMTATAIKRMCCAIYTRVSTDAGLDQDFNSLDAQHDAAQAYIRSQAHAGWMLVHTRYDDGGFSGGS